MKYDLGAAEGDEHDEQTASIRVAIPRSTRKGYGDLLFVAFSARVLEAATAAGEAGAEIEPINT